MIVRVGEGNGEMLVKEYRLPVMNKFWRSNVSMVTIVNNTILYT